MAEMSCFLSSTVFLRAKAGFSRPHLGALLVLCAHEGGEKKAVFCIWNTDPGAVPRLFSVSLTHKHTTDYFHYAKTQPNLAVVKSQALRLIQGWPQMGMCHV